MLSPTRRAIACILIVAGIAVCGHAQSTSSKEPTATISGKVTFHGEGVRGAIVTLRSSDGTSFRKLTNFRGVTDAKGEYRIVNVPAGNYFVEPVAKEFVVDGGLTGERTLTVNDGQTMENFDFSVIRGGVITGRVIDLDGRPVIEEEVYLYSQRNPQHASPLPAAITDDRGVYRIFGLRPGHYTVAAGRDDAGPTSSRPRGALFRRTYHPGIIDPAQATVIDVSDGSEATNVDIVLSGTLTPYTASGRVVNGATGQPISNVEFSVIRFFSPTYTSTSRGPVTNSQGEFKLENLVPGQYAISVKPDGGDWRSDELRFAITDHDVTGLIVRTVRGGSVSGVIVLEGTADSAIREQLRDARLVVFVPTEESNRRGAISGISTVLRPDGSFRIGGLPTGTATFLLSSTSKFRIVRVEHNGLIHARGLAVKQGEDVTGVRIVVSYVE